MKLDTSSRHRVACFLCPGVRQSLINEVRTAAALRKASPKNEYSCSIQVLPPLPPPPLQSMRGQLKQNKALIMTNVSLELSGVGAGEGVNKVDWLTGK